MSKIYLIIIKTIWFKEIRRFIRIWSQTILPSIITVFLYFVIFGHLIGEKIGKMNGINYIEFITPGLIMMSVITNSYINVSSSFFSSKFQKNIEEMLIAPIPSHILILGFIGGGIVRSIIISIIITIMSLFFTSLHIYSFWIITIIILMTSILFSLAGLINGIYAKSFDDISITPTFILTPLTYLGGVFYSLNLLPTFWQLASKLNPIVYMISGLRYGFLGKTDITLYVSINILLFFIVILYVISWQLIEHGNTLKS